jgi:hypothetical protein
MKVREEPVAEDFMDSQHVFLVDGADYAEGRRKIESFLTKNLLVRYASLLFDDPGKIIAKNKAKFWETIDWCQKQNQLTITGLLQELSDLGYESIADLAHVPQGYNSKLLHTITHLLDGFFGLDSFFYNLIEDSHWVSEPLAAKIKQDDQKYFLVFVQGSFQKLEEADMVPHMRRLGVSSYHPGS